MKKIIIIVLIIVILGGSFFLMAMFASMKEDPEQREAEELLRRVQATEVGYATIPSQVIATGRLGSMNYVDLISEVQGEILKGDVQLKKGQSFKKGDLLVRIFDDVMDYNLKAAKSRFLNGIANILPDFRIDFPEDYPKVKRFFDEIRIDQPLPELPGFESEQVRIFLAGRNILNDYYTIKSSEIMLSKHYIRAPFDGTFTQVMLEVGSIANPGSRIARIISTEKLELEVPVDVSDVGWLSAGSEVRVTSEDGAAEWKGTILRIADFVDQNTQSVSVFISLVPTRLQPLYEGQYLRAYLDGKIIEDAMEIPRRAVFNSNEVFVVEDGMLKKETVNIIKVNQETLIFNGLREKSILVTEPLVNAREGNKVDVAL